MAKPVRDDGEARVAWGYPRPEDVPGPTERLRELHGDTDAEPLEPKYGRVRAEQAATEDHVDVEDLVSVTGHAGEAVRDSVAALANRVAEQTASRLRAEMAARGIPERVRQAGRGAGALGASGVLALSACGAATAGAIAAMSEALPVWAASLIAAAALGAPAAVLAVVGRRRLRAPMGPMGLTGER